MMVIFTVMLFLIATSCTIYPNPSLDIFPHYQFACDPSTDVYETEFSFLQGSGHGFVYAEPNRVYFEYYFPVEHWVAFATADQIIQGKQDHCSKCSPTWQNRYVTANYYQPPTNKNDSNLYPYCIEKCLVDSIFVGTVNSDEENINNWDIVEFQIVSQQSKKLGKKMYRIPPVNEILEVWGSESHPYREYAHFETEIIEINVGQDLKKFVHARFWRDYDYRSGQNAWKPFVNAPYIYKVSPYIYQNSPYIYPNLHTADISKSDSFCFISVGSFNGGAYPYASDALNGMIPGFYIDTEHFANIHCYKTNDIKVNCGRETVHDATTPPVINNDNTMKQFNNTKYWIQETIQRKDFDVIIGSHDFIFINFGAEWSIHDTIFAPTWSEAEDKSKGMIFSDKTKNPAVVQLLHINCVTSQDLCSSVGIRAYPTVLLFKRDLIPVFAFYHGERKVDSILDFVKRKVESTVASKSGIEWPSTVNIDVDFEEYLAEYFAGEGDDDDTYYYDDTGLYFDKPIYDDRHPTMKLTVKPTVRNNDNRITSYWIQETIQRKDFDVIIGSHDFTFIYFDAGRCIHCKRFALTWSEAVNKSNGMIFSDKNEKPAAVKLLHINCVTSQDLCADIDIHAYPTVRLYKRDGRFGSFPVYQYFLSRKVDSILDFVKHFVETETVAINSGIRSENNLDEYPEVTDFDDTVEYDDNNAFESINCYYGGILIICIGIVILQLYWICFNKKQTAKEAKEQILLYSTTIETNLGEQDGI